MKIYAITKCVYGEDYHICALTTNHSKAKKLKKIYSDDRCEAEIEGFNDDVLCYRCDKNGKNPEITDYQWNKGIVKNEFGDIRSVIVYAKNEVEAETKAKDILKKYKKT